MWTPELAVALPFNRAISPDRYLGSLCSGHSTWSWWPSSLALGPRLQPFPTPSWGQFHSMEERGDAVLAVPRRACPWKGDEVS